MLRKDFGVLVIYNKKSHGAEVHRGIQTQVMTANGQQAHSEKVFDCGQVLQRSIETWSALLSLGFSYTRSSPMDKSSLHQETRSVKYRHQLYAVSIYDLQSVAIFSPVENENSLL